MLFSPDIRTNSPAVHVLTPTLRLHWDKPEDAMNKLMTAALIAGGLMLMNSPEAAAHSQVRHAYQPPMYKHVQVRRAEQMPHWLKRQKAFRHWYRHSSLRRDRRLAWHQLYEIYHWERRVGMSYRRSDSYWRHYYDLRYSERHNDRDRRHKGHRRH